MTTLSVGSGQQYTTLAAAIAASHDGDTIAVQAGTYTNDFSAINTRITIQGVGGMVNLVATVSPPDGKAILTVNTDVTIDHVAFSGAAVGDGNGAGIRYQGGNLVLDHTYIHNNQEGLLSGAVPGGSITIRNSEFAFNGTGDGYTHNLYVGEISNLTIDNSYFHDAAVGHEIKSRADVTTITNTRIYDNGSTASYSVDLPNGGKVVLSNDVIEQGQNPQNPAIIHFGGEGGPYAGSSLQITGDTVVNDLASGSASLLLNQTSVTATISNDSTYGLTASQIASGPANISGVTMLSSRPTLDTSSPWATDTNTPAPAPTPTPAPTSPTPTTGSDTLVLHLSEDAYQGDAQFIVKIDGTQLGGAQSVTASHAAGATQDFTFTGNFGTGQHTVSVSFLNDAYGGSASTDRNLYVDSLDFDGVHQTVGAALYRPDTANITVPAQAAATPTPAPTPTPTPAPTSPTPTTGSDTLVLHLSEDAYQGDAQFIVKIDGTQLGGAQSVTASHAAGATQDFTFTGNFGTGQHTVSVSFLNDAYGGSASTDRNLYVDLLDFDGVHQAVGAALYRPDTANITVAAQAAATPTPAPAPAPTGSHSLTLLMAEDAYQGDAQFTVAVDGQQIGGVRSVTASHASGQAQSVTLNGLAGGSHTVGVTYLNDASGGTATTDRNLYVDAIIYDGQYHAEANAALLTNGTATFRIDPWN